MNLFKTHATQRFSIEASVEQVLLIASVFWALAANHLFLNGMLQGRSFAQISTWGFVLALLGILTALQFLILAPFMNRWTVKPLLSVLILATASAMYFMQTYKIYLDPSMLRNVMRTDTKEARELLSWRLGFYLLLYGLLPLLLLWRVRIVRRPWVKAFWTRLVSMLIAFVALSVLVVMVFQSVSATMRNHKELRYLMTPANYLWSLSSVAFADSRHLAQPRLAIGLDAQAGPSWKTRTKPLLVVMVVGETARAMNWGLNGYERQTTPELARLSVINFPDVRSCGTNTEVSLPCMFAPVGRRDYNETTIRRSESLLHVLARAGVAVHWRDNQSGCKGVCEGLPNEVVSAADSPGLCDKGRCFDAALLTGLDQRLAQLEKQGSGTQLLVLHQLGNHGPAYFRRYPPAFKKFQPACEQDELSQCSRQEIVNAYDNALLYTDHVLASLIQQLQQRADQIDSVVLYVSDHGESLGEKNFYLHGMPYVIASQEQTQVPMLMWLSTGAYGALGINASCLRQQAQKAISHDYLFHTLLGVLDVKTSVYESPFDLTSSCQTAR